MTLLAANGSTAMQELPRLAGTVIGPASRTALIELGLQQHGVAEGDWVAGWRVESIAAGSAVLIGRDGRLSLSVAARTSLLDDSTPRQAFSWTNPCGRLHPASGHRDATACRSAQIEAYRSE